MPQIEYNIDFGKILEVALKGVRRATVFLGLGVNAALDTNFNKYQLTEIAQIQLLPQEVDARTLSHFKDEFKTWVVGNGLRELIETFSVFLERLHEACLVIENHVKPISLKDLAEQQAGFVKYGLPKKFTVMKEKFSVGPKHPVQLLTLNKARNCLTHRRGLVERIDCNLTDSLKVSWVGADIFVQTPSGEKHLLEKGLVLAEGGDIMLQFLERERVFPVGSVVRFSPKELAEICWFFIREAQTTCETAAEFANSKNIPMSEMSQHPKSNAPGTADC
jgi:hypothetical protein